MMLCNEFLGTYLVMMLSFWIPSTTSRATDMSCTVLSKLIRHCTAFSKPLFTKINVQNGMPVERMERNIQMRSAVSL